MPNNSKETAIKVSNVKKHFRLPHEKANSLKSSIVNIFKREKGYSIQHALDDVSFEIKKGEFFGILGRNGSGKSTLLKILAEIYQPTSGKVEHDGKLVPFIELGVGFNPELTGRENVFLNGALLGFTEKEIEARYEDIVKFAELEDFMDQKLKNYSSGMQVRLAFSVATRAEADILLVDEVLAVGDADFQRKCFDYFSSLKKADVTVVFVTHDMGAVREYCDRAVLVDGGKIIAAGEASDVSSEYLKLFNTESKESLDSDSNQAGGLKRWGNRQIRATKWDLRVKERITAVFEVESKIDVDNVVIGFRFYDGQNNILAGVSSVNAKVGAKKRISFKRGEKKKISFSFDNILGTGTYRMGYTIRLTDLVTICDDNEDAIRFNYNTAESFQPIICPAELIIDSKVGQ